MNAGEPCPLPSPGTIQRRPLAALYPLSPVCQLCNGNIAAETSWSLYKTLLASPVILPDDRRYDGAELRNRVHRTDHLRGSCLQCVWCVVVACVHYLRPGEALPKGSAI